MKVKLIQYTENPERVVAMAARLCYSPIGAEELSETMSEEQIKKLVTKIVSLGHASTLEHASFTFAIEGISRVLTHQLVRHRIASYSQQRYVSEHDFEYIMPPAIADRPEAKAKFEQLMQDIRTAYDDLSAMGVPKEDARYVLAMQRRQKLWRLLMPDRCSILSRCCNRAQWEIRAMANLMVTEVKKSGPVIVQKCRCGMRADRTLSGGVNDLWEI